MTHPTSTIEEGGETDPLLPLNCPIVAKFAALPSLWLDGPTSPLLIAGGEDDGEGPQE